MEAYLDNSATTAVEPAVAELVMKLMTEDYGNPSSMHRRGFEAEKYMREAAQTFADIFRCTPGEIIFTSGGTESDNMAILGAAYAHSRQGKHIITTEIEHAAVSAPFKFLESQGYEVTRLGVDNEGVICLDELRDSIRDDTILVSIMHVNNEIGSVQPVAEAGEMIKSINPGCLFHVDDIQGFGKLALNPKTMKIDMISVSGHKIHGPKGTGILYVSKDTRILPMILGGGQQKGMRSGTENVPGAAGMALAAKLMTAKMSETTPYLYELRKYFTQQIMQIDDVWVNGPADDGLAAPHIVSLSIEGVRAEVILHALEEKNVFVSAGSACSSNKPAVSATLKAIGIRKELLDSTIRFSFSVHTTKEEIDYAVEALKELLPMLRRFRRR